MGIRQLNGSYILAEDRIVLRVATEAGEEFRFWLTRPVTAQLLGAIRTTAAQSIAQKFPPQVAQTVNEFQQQAVAQQTKLDDTFVPGTTFPLGELPALVVKLGAAVQGDAFLLDLGLPNGANVNLRLGNHLVQQFGVLIDRLQANANWQLAAPPAPAVPPAGDDTSRVH
mgnify:FL=1